MSVQESNSQLLQTNGLLYKMPQPLSTTVNRTFKREFAQRTSYSPGDTIVFDINSGSSYIDPKNCMLSWEVDHDCLTTPQAATDTVTFGSGTSANLIQEIRIMSKNGTELERIQRVDVLAKLKRDYLYGSEGQNMLHMAGNGQTITEGTPRTFVIPMELISGFFNPTVKGMKIPSGVASGLRIEIILNTAARALTKGAGNGSNVTYTINNPELLFMCHDLNDPTQAALMKNSAETGLEYTFTTYFHTLFSTTQLTSNEQVKKAVSQATRVLTTAYDIEAGGTGVDVTDEANDGYTSINGNSVTSLQFRVGSSYYPQQALTDSVEMWYVAEAAVDKVRDWKDMGSNVTLANYQTGGRYMGGVPLETDSRLNLSGIPINNSSVLEFRTTVNDATNKEFHIFLEYLAVCRTHVNRSTLKI